MKIIKPMLVHAKNQTLGVVVHFDTDEVEFIIPESETLTGKELLAFFEIVQQCLSAFEKEGGETNGPEKHSPSQYN